MPWCAAAVGGAAPAGAAAAGVEDELPVLILIDELQAMYQMGPKIEDLASAIKRSMDGRTMRRVRILGAAVYGQSLEPNARVGEPRCCLTVVTTPDRCRTLPAILRFVSFDL